MIKEKFCNRCGMSNKELTGWTVCSDRHKRHTYKSFFVKNKIKYPITIKKHE